MDYSTYPLAFGAEPTHFQAMHLPSVIVRVGKGGRLAVPSWMREIYGLKPGGRAEIVANRDGWLLLRAARGRARLRPAGAGRVRDAEMEDGR